MQAGARKLTYGITVTGLIAAVCGLAAAGPGGVEQVPAQQPAPGSVTPPGPGGSGPGQPGDEPPSKPFAEVAKGYDKVVSTADGESFYGIWKREKDGQLLAELPRGWQNQKHYFAMTMPTGEIFAGLQTNEIYAYWKKFDKRMALVTPDLGVRSTGDRESKDAIKAHFVDRVLLDVPIECTGPNGQPVIDLDAMLLGNASVFYGQMAAGMNSRLATIDSVKSFPKNSEISLTVPAQGGRLKTYHYSISLIEDNPSYKPRVADERVGYFTTTYRDLGKYRDDEVAVRYINRWHIEKADPGRKLSPPKVPLVYYIEHTVPIRYRRWVREGVLYWNAAFEKVGIKDAIEVYYQDKSTGAHMDKDPEDVRYNFVRWLSNDIGTAIGPSRAHPITGEILDADIVLTDGWIRHFWYQANEFAPNIAMEGFNAETIAWLDSNPMWDPRVLLASPMDRERIVMERQVAKARRGVLAYGGRPVPVDATVDNNPDLSRLSELVRPQAGLCMASEGLARDMAISGLYMDVMGMLDLEQPADEPKKEDGKKEDKKKDDSDKIDGIPEWFVGPALAHLTVHEVGHTLGLRHNFKASSQYTLKEINSEAMKGKAFVSSVMDYTPININMDENSVQGDYSMFGVGDYDMWAIEYGYTFGDTKEVLKKVNKPGHQYLTDEDTGGPDPLARRYDFSANPLDYAKSLVKLANVSRAKILDKFVKDGEPWSKARRGYEITLSTQLNAISIMAGWIGGSDINRNRKGDPDAVSPITPIEAQKQRDALKFVLNNAFNDDAFGLTPELLTRMTVNKDENSRGDPTYAIHDRISGVQASVLTMLMNPTVLRRVYDNEFLIASDKDALTLPELMDSVSNTIWTELDANGREKFTARKPMISSLRRNLQREHLTRLIDLSLQSGFNAASKPISNLAILKLRGIRGKIADLIGEKGDKGSNIDPYTVAHLAEAKTRIDKALDAIYVYNAGGGGGMNIPWGLLFGQMSQDGALQSGDSPQPRP